MSLKEKLQEWKKELKNNLQEEVLRNRDYEFDAELENHPLGNQNIYRLYFINYHRIGENYGIPTQNNIGIINWPFKPFTLPDGMNREDAFKVLSYLTDFIEKESNLEPCSFKIVEALDKVIDLERLGFKRLDTNFDDYSLDVINLFTISGRILLFKKSQHYDRYFEWYSEGVTFDEVKNIYNKCGIDFYDLVPINKENEDSISKEPAREKIMEFVEKNENIERVYSVCYDVEKLKELLDEIVKKASYKTDGRFTAPYNASFEGNVFTSGADLPNGDPMFENIKRIYYYTSDGPYSYHNDSIAVEGTQVTPPELAFIIERILSDEPNSIYELLNYATHDELVPIDEKIAAANRAVNGIDNFDFDKKINALNSLKHFCEDKKTKEYFDVELLKQYYLQARSLFELQLVSEKTMKNSGRILLKDYKPMK